MPVKTDVVADVSEGGHMLRDVQLPLTLSDHISYRTLYHIVKDTNIKETVLVTIKYLRTDIAGSRKFL